VHVLSVRQKYDNHRIEYSKGDLGRNRMLLGGRWRGACERSSLWRLVTEGRIVDCLRFIHWHLWHGLLGDGRTNGDKSFESAFKTTKPASMGQGFLVLQFDSACLALFRVLLPAVVL
jgi:hypothetical protein